MKTKEQMARIYYLAFSVGDGAEVLEDLYRSYMDRGSFDENFPNCCKTSYHEGQRSVVLAIKAMMAMGVSEPSLEDNSN